MMPETLSPDLLARYLSGTATEAERQAVEAWAESAPAHRGELDRLRAVYRSSPAGEWDVDRAWRRVSARLDDAATATATVVVELRAARRRWLAVAATVTLAVAAGWLWTTTRRPDPAAPFTVATVAGEQHTLALEDGTRITLAPLSRVTVTLDGEDGARHVALDGEAWFEVEHDAARPFRVHAGGTVTEVLGTRFLVQEAAAEGGVRVALVSGRTSFRREDGAPESAAILTPGDLAILDPGDTLPTVIHGAELGALLAWRDGRLEFDDAPLGEVRLAFARWFGVTLVLADPALETRRFSGTFQLDALEDALDVLALSLGVRTERRADSVFLR